MSDTNWIRENISQVKKAVKAGNAAATAELAKRYFTGRDVDRSPQEGFSWAEAAASRGNLEAAQILGYCYATGTGVQASGRKAYELFVRAALLGNAVALYNLAICYDYGIGVERDYRMARSLYQRSAEAGYAKAKHVLAAKLWNRDCSDTKSERRDTILAWYASQANRGDELARRNLTLVRRNRKVHAGKEFTL